MRRTRLWRLLLGCLGGKGGLVSLDLMDGLMKSRVFFLYVLLWKVKRGKSYKAFTIARPIPLVPPLSS